MKKIISLILLALIFIVNIVYSDLDFNWIKIISRNKWWANEELRYSDSEIWKRIFEREAKETKPKTESQLQREERNLNINKYLNVNFPLQETAVQTISKENWRVLVWPIQKTKRVEKIIVHHTAENSNSIKSDIDIIRWIYYYHAITNWWWDIGYNYLIWRDGAIYEWRAWWDYVVWAHALWNNRSTVWIWVIWEFQNGNMPSAQREWLESLIGYLSKKYGIDLNKTSISHKECKSSEDCLIKDYFTKNLIWHRDVWYTTCPWDHWYGLVLEMLEYWSLYSSWFIYIENQINDNYLQKVNLWPNIKIKLSFNTDKVQIKPFLNEKMKIFIWNKSWFVKNLLTLEKYDKNKIKLTYKNKSVILKSIKITWSILEISNWDRIPEWDKEGKYNDNKFRNSLIIYNNNWELVILNELPIEDYLKWLAEMSNDENPEKVKTIIIAARSYALYYTSKVNRKFPWKDYDWSDDPDVFQKYLWYWFELRWQNIVNAVNETQWIIIMYDNKLIKPWYFNQSDGKTLSVKEYCEINWKKDCEDIPYLQSVIDPAWNLWLKWHWVGISWAWAKVLAEDGYTYDKIIKYFLQDVSIEKKY